MTGDTKVSLSNGCSKRIDSLTHDELVLGCNNGVLNNYSTINGLQVKGQRETVKVWLQDGTTICCTPEHKFMLENGEWCRADELKDKYVTCGIDYPEDKICPLEEDWELELDRCTLDMKTYENREKSLAFARMLGYILTDGSIGEYKNYKGMIKTVYVCFGTMIDAINFRNDILKFFDTIYDDTCEGDEPSRDRYWQNQKYLFTYETHINKTEYLKWIVEKNNGTQPKFIRVAHEVSGNKRTHVIIDFGRQLRSNNKNFFDYGNIYCNRKIIFSRGIHKNDWQKCIQYYITKDPDNYDLISTFEMNAAAAIPIRKREEKKGITYAISIPKKLSNIIHSVKDLIVGERTIQKSVLPAFILNENCPLSILREFLGGLYGGDGSAPCYRSSNRFAYIRFTWSTIEKHKKSMNNVFDSLTELLNKLNVDDVDQDQPIKVNYRKGDIKPEDWKDRWNYTIRIGEHGTIAFNENVGFRYCINKSCRLTVVSSYLKMLNKVREQHSKVFYRTLELMEQRKLTTKSALDISRTQIFENEPVINKCSLSSPENVRDVKCRRKQNDGIIPKMRSEKILTPLDFLTETQTLHWFGRGNYASERDDFSIPTLKKKVIDVKQDIVRGVYDIEVDVVHNFLANGVIVKNCSLYPSIIIAYNIDYSCLVDDPYLASKGILNTDIPDSKCNIFDWSEHINCRHDEMRGKKEQEESYMW